MQEDYDSGDDEKSDDYNEDDLHDDYNWICLDMMSIRPNLY